MSLLFGIASFVVSFLVAVSRHSRLPNLVSFVIFSSFLLAVYLYFGFLAALYVSFVICVCFQRIASTELLRCADFDCNPSVTFLTKTCFAQGFGSTNAANKHAYLCQCLRVFAEKKKWLTFFQNWHSFIPVIDNAALNSIDWDQMRHKKLPLTISQKKD